MTIPYDYIYESFGFEKILPKIKMYSVFGGMMGTHYILSSRNFPKNPLKSNLGSQLNIIIRR